MSLRNVAHISALIKQCGLLLILSAAISVNGVADSVSLSSVGLFNTGENSNGTLATQGAADPNYTTQGSTVYVLGSPDLSAWVSPNTVAQYVGPDTADGSVFGNGFYTLDYDISFDLTGYDPASVVIAGTWSTDNLGNNIFVNGTASGNTSPSFTSLTSFTLDSGFTTGINTIDFRWTNEGGPGGLLVEFTSITANSSATPEPSTMVIGVLGLGLMGLRRFRSVGNQVIEIN